MKFERDVFLSLDEMALLAQCEQDFFIGTGAGGQHRNKTQSGVRLTHLPSKCVVTDCAERQREINRKNAVKKMKIAVAFAVREPPTQWHWDKTPSLNSDLYCLFIAQLFDYLTQCNYQLKTAAEQMNCSTAQLSKFILRDPHLVQKVNFEREKRGFSNLKGH